MNDQDKILADIDALILDMKRGDVTLQDYGVKLAELQQQLSTTQELNTQMKPFEKEPALEITEYMSGARPLLALQASKKIEQKKSETPPTPTQTFKQSFDFAEQEREWQEFFEQSQREARKQLESKKFFTGEWGEAPSDVGVSTIRDPIAGEVYDAETDTYRKAGSGELIYEGLFRQVRATPKQREAYIAQKETERQQKADALRAEGKTQDEVAEELEFYDNMEEKLGSQYTESGYVVETPLAYGLRMLNTGSAFVAIPYTKATELLGAEETQQTYRRTDSGAFWDQYAANLATGQGVFTAFEDYLPSDGSQTGLGSYFERGDVIPTIIGFAAEMSAPVTPVPIATGATKVVGKGLQQGAKLIKAPSASVKVARLGQAVESPFTAIRYSGAKAELEKAFALAEDTTTIREIEEELVRKGTLSPSTLRDKASEALGDVVAGHRAIEDGIQYARARKHTHIYRGDFPTESKYVASFFGMEPSLRLPKASQLHRTFDLKLNELAAQDPMWSRINAVQRQARNSRTFSQLYDTKTGARQVSIDQDLLEQALKREGIRTLEWDEFADEDIGRIGELLGDSTRRPLKVVEIEELGDLMKEYGSELEALLIRQTLDVGTRYRAVQQTASKVSRDNFLAQIPEDMVYVSSDVAVPLNKVKGSTKQMDTFQRELMDLLKYDEIEVFGNGYSMSANQAKKVNLFFSSRGLNAPSGIRSRMIQAARGDSTLTLFPQEFRELEDIIRSELAMRHLDGVKLRIGGLTGELAAKPSIARGEIIPRGQRGRGTFSIKATGLANAVRIATEGTFLEPVTKLFGKSRTTPVAFVKFVDELEAANNAAAEMVKQDFLKAGSEATDPVTGFNRVLESTQTSSRTISHFEEVLPREDMAEAVVRSDRAFQRQTDVSGMSPRDLYPAEIDWFVSNPVEIAEQSRRKFKVQQFVYGDDATKKVLAQMNLTEESIVDVDALRKLKDGLLRNYAVSVAKKDWKYILNTFFGSKNLEIATQTKAIERVLSKIEGNAIATVDDIFDVTLENFKEVAERLYKLRPELTRSVLGKEYRVGLGGVTKLAVKGDEAYAVPLVEWAISVQRRLNAKQTVERFVARNDNYFIDMKPDTTVTGTLLSAQRFENTINAVRQSIYTGFGSTSTNISKDVMAQGLRQIIFEGVETDLLRSMKPQGRKQLTQMYLEEVVQQGTFYPDTRLLAQKYFVEIAPTETPALVRKALEKYTKSNELILDSAGRGIVSVSDKAKWVDNVMEDFTATYYSAMLGTDVESVGLVTIFGHQQEQINTFLNTYGLASFKSLDTDLRNLVPQVDYIGDSTLGLMYGQDYAKQIRQIKEMAGSSQFSDKLEALRAIDNGAAQFVGSVTSTFFSGARRWATAHMLGGGILPTPRFFGMNRLTAPFIMHATLGGFSDFSKTSAWKFVSIPATMGLDGLAVKVTQALRPSLRFNGFMRQNRVLGAPDAEIVIKARAGGATRDYSAKELRDLINYHGIEASRMKVEFGEAELRQLFSDIKLRDSGVPKNLVEQGYDLIDPTKMNVWAKVGSEQDNELRRLVFIESIDNGATASNAAELARRSMLDYNSLTGIERQYAQKYIMFYTFMRSMAGETINAMYRSLADSLSPSVKSLGVVSLPKVLRAQDSLNRSTSKDYYSLSNQQLGRMYNIYTDTIDDQDIYAGGPLNPTIQGFELLCQTPFMVAHAVKYASERGIVTAGTEALYVGIQESLYKKVAEGTPMTDYFVKTLLMAEKNPPSFPVEIIYAAEKGGGLPELIKKYGLEKKGYKSPARPLSMTGDQYYFPPTSVGRANYKRFLQDQVIAMYSSNVLIDLGLETMIGEKNYARQVRAVADWRKGRMYARYDSKEVPSPTGQGTLEIPTDQVYLKGKAAQDDTALMWSLYMIGAITPIASMSVDRRLEMGLNSIVRDLDEAQKILQSQQ